MAPLNSWTVRPLHVLDRDPPSLWRIKEVFGLSTTERGRLFGVRRQAGAGAALFLGKYQVKVKKEKRKLEQGFILCKLGLLEVVLTE